MQKKAGDTCEIGGLYLCLYHFKNKLKIKKGMEFPRCDFAGIKCVGFWHLKKEIKEKTQEEKWADQNRKRYKPRRNKDWDFLSEPPIDKPPLNWDWEKW